MTDNTQRFSNRVEDYVRYRPDYPAALFDYLYTKERFSAESAIADIGSGTGIFSRGLLARGSKVYGIEPNAPMRLAAEEALAAEPNFTSVNGTAEATGLKDGAVDHVVCAQSFHWFDRKTCRREFDRILRPDGRIVLIWNSLKSEDRTVSAYEETLSRYIPEEKRIDHKKLTDADFADFFQGLSWRHLQFAHEQRLDREGLSGRLRSSSYAPLPGEPAYLPLMAELNRLFNRDHGPDGRIVFPYETNVYIASTEKMT